LANTFLFQFYDQVTPLAGSTAVRASIVETARKYLDGLSREAGNDKGLILELAQAYQRLGDVQGRTGGANLGQLEEARRSYRTALDLYERLGVGRDSPQELRIRLARALWALGRLEYNAERLPAADVPTRRMVDLLSVSNPDGETWKWRLIGERSLSDIRLSEGRAAEAVALLQSVRKGLMDLRATGYQDPNFSNIFSEVQLRLARARVKTGDLDAALSDMQELLRTSPPCDEDGLPGPDCRDFAVWLSWTADVYGQQDLPNLGELDKAAVLYERAIRISERLAALDANDRQTRFDLGARYGKLGDVLWRKDPRRALDLYERALATAKELASKEQFEMMRGAYLSAITRPLIQLRRLAEARKIEIENVKVAKAEAQNSYADLLGEFGERLTWASLLIAEGKREEAGRELNQLIRDADAARAAHPQDLTPTYRLSDACRMLAAISTGQQRREALLKSAAAWHSWPATSFTRREEQKDLAAARLN
jgi:hypothetical protein